MAQNSMDLLELLRKRGMDGDVDFLREALSGPFEAPPFRHDGDMQIDMVADLYSKDRGSGTPGGTRTPDARLRTPPLCPTELQGQKRSGGDSGARTRNLGIANAALSQLSYIPTFRRDALDCFRAVFPS